MGYYVKKIEVGNNNKEKYFDLYETVPGSKDENLIGRLASKENNGKALEGNTVGTGLYAVGKIKNGEPSKISYLLGSVKVGKEQEDKKGFEVIKYRKKSADKKVDFIDEPYTYKPETPKRETPKTSDESKTSENAVGEFLGREGGNSTPEPETKAVVVRETPAIMPPPKASALAKAPAPEHKFKDEIKDYELDYLKDSKDVLKEFEAIKKRYSSLATKAKNKGVTGIQGIIDGFSLRVAQDTITNLRTVIFNENHTDLNEQKDHANKMTGIIDRAYTQIDGYVAAKGLNDKKLEKKAWKDLNDIYKKGLDEIEREMSAVQEWAHSKKKGLKGFFTSLFGMESLSKRTVNACFKKVGEYFQEKEGEDFKPLELYKLFKDMKKDAKEWYETVKYALGDGMNKFNGKDVKTISFVTILLSMVNLKDSKFIIEAELGFSKAIPSSGALKLGEIDDKENDDKENAEKKNKEIFFSDIKTLCKNIGALAGNCDKVENLISNFAITKTDMVGSTTYKYIKENLGIKN